MPKRVITISFAPKLFTKIELYQEITGEISKSGFIRSAIKYYTGLIDRRERAQTIRKIKQNEKV